MENQALKGGEFIIRDVHFSDVFIPEEWNEEQKMISSMCDDFIHQEVLPYIDQIDKMEAGLMESIVLKAGELGLLGLSVPENLGGMGVDFKTSFISY